MNQSGHLKCQNDKWSLLHGIDFNDDLTLKRSEMFTFNGIMQNIKSPPAALHACISPLDVSIVHGLLNRYKTLIMFESLVYSVNSLLFYFIFL